MSLFPDSLSSGYGREPGSPAQVSVSHGRPVNVESVLHQYPRKLRFRDLGQGNSRRTSVLISRLSNEPNWSALVLHLHCLKS
jgi:hypothetical protein